MFIVLEPGASLGQFIGEGEVWVCIRYSVYKYFSQLITVNIIFKVFLHYFYCLVKINCE